MPWAQVRPGHCTFFTARVRGPSTACRPPPPRWLWVPASFAVRHIPSRHGTVYCTRATARRRGGSIVNGFSLHAGNGCPEAATDEDVRDPYKLAAGVCRDVGNGAARRKVDLDAVARHRRHHCRFGWYDGYLRGATQTPIRAHALARNVTRSSSSSSKLLPLTSSMPCSAPNASLQVLIPHTT